MEWLEIIELRTGDSNRELLESQLQGLLDEVDPETGQQAIKAYRHSILDTDFGIHLFHTSKMPEHSGSRLGLHLASALREFGLVSHNVWIEIQNK